ncbi:DUF5336 domain-containing protein [Mycolicibacterium sediminis]|uniref:34 kDa antigenic protein n=1 Tax=Mycolicibacterium sediminis TaxID=1286180 RepID=A0A7I7QZG8_9MYCO|nr:DUF5336 domain-containing protein [Mycolicibacterium sediminis]BBY31741.1 hypothetical protein MSEDJ_58370 [Mycolicibacterium sediminis]
MSYPSGNPGYPPPAAPTTQFAAPTQQFAKQPEPGQPSDSKLPLFLSIGIAVLGLAAYLASFGPIFVVDISGAIAQFPGIPQESLDIPSQKVNGGAFLTSGGGTAIIAILLGALIAGVGALPRQKPRRAIVAVLSVFGFLVILLQLVGPANNNSAGWALITITVLAFLQAAASIANLLLDAGVITAPEPKPKYDQQPYGGYAPPQYYGQQPGQPGQQGGPHQGQPQQQRPGYAPQYGYGNGPSTGGFPGSAPQSGPHGGPPTPPTGFPAYGQPQPPGNSDNTGPQAQVQPSPGQPTQQPQQSPSQQASPPPS